LALVTAWRFVLYRLHGLGEWDRGVREALAFVKRATTSQGVLRYLEELRKAAERGQAGAVKALD
jgi:hypothetical protein